MSGTIVVLSGPSRAGKSTIAAGIQETLDGIWMHIGMDLHIQATPPRYKPGIGLRPVRPEDVRDVEDASATPTSSTQCRRFTPPSTAPRPPTPATVSTS